MGKLENKKIAIIGMGHMGKSLLQGLYNAGFKKKNILSSNKSIDNKKVASQSDFIFLAVKPSILHQVVKEIKNEIQDKILISVAAAVTISHIEGHTENKNQKIIRIMPNIPIAYNQGVIGFYSNKYVKKKDKQEVITLLSSLGTVIEVTSEKEIDTLTVLSACAPAIVSYFMDMFIKIGELEGLKTSTLQKAIIQAFLGTSIYLQKTKQSPSELQLSVATKGGITKEIIKNLEKGSIFLEFKNSLKKGFTKIERLSKNS